MDVHHRFNIAQEETYDPGEIIFKEGSSGDWVYVVIEGSVEISKNIAGKRRLLEILKPGEIFGELGFIGGIKRTATARAVDKTTIGLLDREVFEKEFNQLSSPFRTVIQTMTKRFQATLERACDFKVPREPRVPKSLSLTFKDRQAFIQAYTANASTGGLFIKADTPLDAGAEFQLKLELPGLSVPLEVKCEVIWTRNPEDSKPRKPAGMGVKFREISQKDYQALKKFLASADKHK